MKRSDMVFTQDSANDLLVTKVLQKPSTSTYNHHQAVCFSWMISNHYIVVVAPRLTIENWLFSFGFQAVFHYSMYLFHDGNPGLNH